MDCYLVETFALVKLARIFICASIVIKTTEFKPDCRAYGTQHWIVYSEIVVYSTLVSIDHGVHLDL